MNANGHASGGGTATANGIEPNDPPRLVTAAATVLTAMTTTTLLVTRRRAARVHHGPLPRHDMGRLTTKIPLLRARLLMIRLINLCRPFAARRIILTPRVAEGQLLRWNNQTPNARFVRALDLIAQRSTRLVSDILASA